MYSVSLPARESVVAEPVETLEAAASDDTTDCDGDWVGILLLSGITVDPEATVLVSILVSDPETRLVPLSDPVGNVDTSGEALADGVTTDWSGELLVVSAMVWEASEEPSVPKVDKFSAVASLAVELAPAVVSRLVWLPVAKLCSETGDEAVSASALEVGAEDWAELMSLAVTEEAAVGVFSEVGSVVACETASVVEELSIWESVGFTNEVVSELCNTRLEKSALLEESSGAGALEVVSGGAWLALVDGWASEVEGFGVGVLELSKELVVGSTKEVDSWVGELDVTASSEVVVGWGCSDEGVPTLEVVVGSCSKVEVDGVSIEVELGLGESEASGVLVCVVRAVVGGTE